MKETFKATFGDVKIGKKTTIAVEIKGSLTDEQKLSLLDFAQSDGFIQLATAQRDITDYPQHEGIQYKLDGGNVNVDPNQLDMDEIVGGEQQEDGWKSDENQELTDDMEQQIIVVSVEVLKAFKYQERTVKKGSVIQVPIDTAQGLEDAGVVKVVPSEELPF